MARKDDWEVGEVERAGVGVAFIVTVSCLSCFSAFTNWKYSVQGEKGEREEEKNKGKETQQKRRRICVEKGWEGKQIESEK